VSSSFVVTTELMS